MKGFSGRQRSGYYGKLPCYREELRVDNQHEQEYNDGFTR